jgi:hypothetical protein
VSGLINTATLNVSGTANAFALGVGSLNVAGVANTASLGVSGLINTATLNVSGTANAFALGVGSLNVAGVANTASLGVSGLINTSTLNVSGTANAASLGVGTLNVAEAANTASLGVSGLVNTASLNVSGTANAASLGVGSLNVAGVSNAASLGVSGQINTASLNVSGTANAASLGVGSLNVAGVANAASLDVSGQINVATLNVSGTANAASLGVGSLNVAGAANAASLGVSGQINVATLNVSGTANAASLGVGTLNVAGAANAASLGVSGQINAVTINASGTANAASLGVGSLNVAGTANAASLGVSGQINAATLNISGTANAASLGVGSLNVEGTVNAASIGVSGQINVATLNVSGTANAASLGVSSNVIAADALRSKNVWADGLTSNSANTVVSSTINLTGGMLVSGAVAGAGQTLVTTGTGAGVQWGTLVSSQWTTGTNNIYYFSNVGIGTSAVSSNLYVVGNVFASNALQTKNVWADGLTSNSANTVVSSTINLTGGLLVSGAAAGAGQTLVTTGTGAGVQWGTLISSQWTTGTNNIYYFSNVGIGTSAVSANVTVSGNIYASNALSTTNIFTTNLTATGTISGAWTGVSQGTLLTLGSTLATTAFTSSSDAPTLQATHLNLSSFTPSGSSSSYTITAQGLIKFSAVGLYQVQMVLVADAPVRKLALGTNTSSAFLSSTSAYTYVIDVPVGQSSTVPLVIPINVTSTAPWYYIDMFTQTTVGTGSLYLTASSTVSGTKFGTWLQISPFGNYISSAVNAAAGLLMTTSGTTLSSPVNSNTYRLSMTSGAGWTTSGTSASMIVSTGGNLRFYQAGVYQVNLCLNPNLQPPVQFGIASSATDATTSSTQGPYLYSYAPTYTQDPSTTVTLPVNVTDVTKFYYIDVTFGGTTTTVSLLSTSTFVSVSPLSSYIPNPMATASVVVSSVATAQTVTPYTALSTDYYIGRGYGGTIIIPQGATLTPGKVYVIKDESGLAGTNAAYNITIQMSGADTIDGQTSASIQLAWTSVSLMWTGAANKWSFI